MSSNTSLLTDMFTATYYSNIFGYTNTSCKSGEDMSEKIIDAVRSRYGAIANSGMSIKNDGVMLVAEAFGYTPEELASIPAEASLGLSCGNPIATAHIREGETVVDLGSGGGLDVFLAATKVGPSGRAIGIDMTPEMIQLARKNAAKLSDGGANIEFHHAMIDKIPLENDSVDCVISNCVINLAPDKKEVFREIARILKPGGRVAVSDIALKGELPSELSNDLLSYVGCVAGAITLEEYRLGLLDAGFSEVMIIDSNSDLNVYTEADKQSCSTSGSMSDAQSLPIANSGSCCGTGVEVLAKYDLNAFAASVKVFAVKP